MSRPLESPSPGHAHIDDADRLASSGLLGDRLWLRVMRPRDHLVVIVSATDCTMVVDTDRVPRPRPVEGEDEPRLIVGERKTLACDDAFGEGTPIERYVYFDRFEL